MNTMTVRFTALAAAVIATAGITPAFAESDATLRPTSAIDPAQTQVQPRLPLSPASDAAQQIAQATLPAPAASAPATSASAEQTSATPDTRGTQTLVQLYDVAVSYDALYRAALAQVRANGAAVKRAFAAMLPQVGLQANNIRNRGSVTYDSGQDGPMTTGPNGQPINLSGRTLTESYTQRDAGLQATQALYRPAYRIAWLQSKQQLNIAVSQLKGAKQGLIVRLAQAYFDVLAAQDTLSYLRILKDSVNQQLTMAQRNFQIGNASITDSREAQARLALTNAQEIAAENDLHVKQLALDQLVGQSAVQPRPLLDSVLPTAPYPANVDAWVERSNTAPAVQQARLALEIAKLESDRAKSGQLPTLDLQASIAKGQYPNGDPTGSYSPNYGYRTTIDSIGLQLNWVVFAGGAIVQRERETQALLDKAQADLDNALRSNTQTTRAAYFTLQSGLSQIQALQDAEASSRTALEANQIGYQVGARTNIDVLDAESQLFQTRRDLTHARYDALVNWLRLKQVAGTLTTVDLAQMNRLLAS